MRKKLNYVIPNNGVGNSCSGVPKNKFVSILETVTNGNKFRKWHKTITYNNKF